MRITRTTIIDYLLIFPGGFSLKRRLFRTGCEILFTSIVFITDAYPSGRSIHDDYLFDVMYPNLRQHGFQKVDRTIPPLTQEQQVQARIENQEARKVIDGVLVMYRQDVALGEIRYIIKTDGIVSAPNASYTHGTRTFDFPHIIRNRKSVVKTALDQGIVSHEAGHMVLFYLVQLYSSSHTGAFHEAFGDLTAHFYRFYNEHTRQNFIDMLGKGEGCVGDNAFTCVRNNSHSLTLDHVSQDEGLCEVHELSKPFSNAVFDNMVTSYANSGWLTWAETAAENIVTWHRRTLVNAILSLNSFNPTLMDIAQKMLEVSHSDAQYRDGLGRNFMKSNLIVLIYRSLPTPHYPYPPLAYRPNKKFQTLCLVKKKPIKTSPLLRGA